MQKSGVLVDSCRAKTSVSLHSALTTATVRPANPHQAASDSSSCHEEGGGARLRRGFQPYHSQSVPHSEMLQPAAQESNKPITTMMLRNIPNKYTQNTLLQEIHELGFSDTYNFFYLPMDVHNRSNVGYSFINFHKPPDAERFQQVFTGHHFQRFPSRKIGSVCMAHVQGLDENIRHFENRAVTQARNDQYRPIVIRGQQRVSFEDAVNKLKAKSACAPLKSVASQGKSRTMSEPATAVPEVTASGPAKELPLGFVAPPGFALPLASPFPDPLLHGAQASATLHELMALRAMMWQRLMATGYEGAFDYAEMQQKLPPLRSDAPTCQPFKDLTPMYVECAPLS